jgi:hypothetical protein
MERIYAIHLDNMKKLGTPPHSLKFFVEIWKQMRPKGLVQTYLARYNGRDIAGIVLFPHRESVRWGAGVMLTEYRWLNPLYKILWDAICWSKKQGYQMFDMGGSRKNSGNFLFKEAWVGKNHLNGLIVNLYHLHLSLGKHEFRAVSPSNPRYLYLTNLWHNYVPFPIANSFGPYLRRQLAM